MLRERSGPLSGLRVLELTKVWAGPYAGKLLAFLGAEVIKVESMTQLDEMRAYGGVDIDSAPYFLSINQEVLSVQVNMKSADGMDLLHRMIARCDVVIDNLRPGAMERLGLSYDEVRKIRPDIIQASIKMYGTDGPLGYQTGYAPCFAALGGLTALVGHDGDPPKGMNIRYGDSTVGASAAFAIVAALHHRHRTGEGQFIDVSAVETMSSMIGDSLYAYLATGDLPQPDKNRNPDMVPHGCYRCADGDWLSLAVPDDSAWQGACDVLGIDSAGLETLRQRLDQREEVDRRMGEAMRRFGSHAIAEALGAAGCGVFRSMSSLDLVSDDFLWSSEAYRFVEHESNGSRPIIGPGWKMGPDETQISHGAPRLGEHNAYVYQQLLGLSDSEISELVAKKSIY